MSIKITILLYWSYIIVSSSKYKYACSVQNVNNYGLTVGTAHYYMI